MDDNLKMLRRYAKIIEDSLPEGDRLERLRDGPAGAWVSPSGRLLADGSNEAQLLAAIGAAGAALEEMPFGLRSDFSQTNLSLHDKRRSFPLPVSRPMVPRPWVDTDLSCSEFLAAGNFGMKKGGRERFSFSGTQEKFTAVLTADERAQNGLRLMRIPDRDRFVGNVIVKPVPRDNDFPFLPENEYLCMRTAELLGLDVARPYLVRDDIGHLHLAVERFDIDIAEDGSVTRRFVSTFMSLLGIPRGSEAKYSVFTEELFEHALELLRRPDLELFAAAYAFGWVSGNGDMHAKNFSMFVPTHGERFFSLTPLYDLVCTVIYDGYPDRLALGFGECASSNPPEEPFVSFLLQYASHGDLSRFADLTEPLFAARAEVDAAGRGDGFRSRLAARLHDRRMAFVDDIVSSIQGMSRTFGETLERMRAIGEPNL